MLHIKKMKNILLVLLGIMFSFNQMYVMAAESESLLSLFTTDIDEGHFFLSARVTGFKNINVFDMPIGFNCENVQLCGYESSTVTDKDGINIKGREASKGIVYFTDDFYNDQKYTVLVNDEFPIVNNEEGLVFFTAYRTTSAQADNKELFRLYFKRLNGESAEIKFASKDNSSVYCDIAPNGIAFYNNGYDTDCNIEYNGSDFSEEFKELYHEAHNEEIILDEPDSDNSNSNGNNGISNTGNGSGSKTDSSADSSDVTVPPVQEKKNFNDVTSAHWAYDAIMKLSEDKILNGYDDGGFKPDKNITRAELATVVSKALNAGEESKKELIFTDITDNAWYIPGLKSAYGLGIISGYPDNTFRPDAPVTRQDLCCMLYRAFYNGNDDVAADMTFADTAEISDYASKSVSVLCTKKILSGRDNNRFCPKDNATRAEVARVIYLCLLSGGE